MSGMVDWDFAVRIASRVAGDGPQVSAADAAACVAELRADAERSTRLVRDFTGLDASSGTAPVLVVDRPGWIRANADAFTVILEPIIEKLSAKRGPAQGLSLAIGSRVTGTEVGLLLGFLAGKVLGQFDPFFDPGGRLLLVAPNIVHIERELEVDPSQFRLWVALHEETHRVQFTAVPWLRDHLKSQMAAMAESIEVRRMTEDAVRRAAEALRGEGSLLDMMSTPEQREIMDRVTGVMSLLEGHADVVMDGVGPEVIPDVDKIRAKFNARRGGIGVLDRLLRRLLGLDQKMAQYRDGAKFVRHIVEAEGMQRFNVVWERAENLPSKAEIADPDAWIARVL